VIFEIFAGKIQPATPQNNVSNPKSTSNQVIERHAYHRQIPPVIAWLERNRPVLQRRIVARKRIERLLFDECHFAHVWLR